MRFGEQVRRFRQEKGLTQEQLGERLGVSSQAVSKWETCESYPDAELLVPLANALDASLDVLFSNDAAGEKDAALRIAAVMARTDRRDAFALCRRFGWQMEVSMFCSEIAPDPAGERGMSEIVGDTGFTQISNHADAPYYAVFPEPENGWADAVGGGEIGEVLAALAHDATRRAVLYLMRQKLYFLFEAAVLTEEAGVPPEELDTVMENLGRLRLIGWKRSVDVGGEERELWSYTANQKVLALLILARDVRYHTFYRYQAQGRTDPLIR